jgi:hypothetical protein
MKSQRSGSGAYKARLMVLAISNFLPGCVGSSRTAGGFKTALAKCSYASPN